jgi:serine/threonine protein kinase
MGTPAYLPPELVWAAHARSHHAAASPHLTGPTQTNAVEHYDTIAPYQAADVWMCGVVLFCLATGSFPWYDACGACHAMRCHAGPQSIASV